MKIAIRKLNLDSIRSQDEILEAQKSIYPMTSIYEKGFSFNGGKSKKCRFADLGNFRSNSFVTIKASWNCSFL